MIPAHAQPRAGCRILWQCALLALLLLPMKTIRGDESLENRVKSAFILNFVQFVDWPDKTFAGADEPIIIGLLQNDPIEGVLAPAVEGKTVKNRKIVVKHFAPDAIGACQVLYLGTSDQAAAILKAQAGKAVLTIGEGDGFTDGGGIICFYLEDRKERFEINKAAADRAGLQISSKLLKLAKVVNK